MPYFDFYEEVDFKKTVYVVDFNSGRITEDTLESLILDSVNPTVAVVGKSLHYYYDREIGEKIFDFKTKKEAYHARLLALLWDLDNKDDMPCYRETREEAEAVLNELGLFNEE